MKPKKPGFFEKPGFLPGLFFTLYLPFAIDINQDHHDNQDADDHAFHEAGDLPAEQRQAVFDHADQQRA